MQRQTIQLIGWYGVMAVLVAYGLLNFKVLTADSLWYQVLNLTGASAIAVEAASKHDRQPLALNVIWALVALIAILGMMAG